MALLQTDLVRNALAAGWVVALVKRIVPPLDRFLLRISRGWINTAMQTVVLMDTRGARSGQLRRIATLCVPHGEDLLLAGSNWGQEKHPAWIHNLRANPFTRVWYRGYCGPMQAEEIEGPQRQDLWQKMVEHNPQYAVYQDQVERRIPIMRLRRPG